MKKSIATLALLGLFLAPAAAEKTASAQPSGTEPTLESPAPDEAAPAKRKTRKKRAKKARKAAQEVQQSKAQ